MMTVMMTMMSDGYDEEPYLCHRSILCTSKMCLSTPFKCGVRNAEDATMIVVFRATIIVVILIFLLSDQICVIYVSSVLLDPVGDAEDA